MQRVPVTEKRGRRHTSTVAVAVLDDTRNAEIRLRPDDVRTDTFRSTGAGGQHRNKTDSAIRLTHTPTGIVVTATEERSQHQNRQVAWSRLRAALESRHNAASADRVNDQRQNAFDGEPDWLWCGWRDEVTTAGRRGSMKRALAGRLGPLLG